MHFKLLSRYNEFSTSCLNCNKNCIYYNRNLNLEDFTEETEFKLSHGEQTELCKEETRVETPLFISCTKYVIKCNLCSSLFMHWNRNLLRSLKQWNNFCLVLLLVNCCRNSVSVASKLLLFFKWKFSSLFEQTWNHHI